MQKSLVVTLVLCVSALVTSSALGLVVANQRAAHLGTPALEHVKPAPDNEATPPKVITMAKRMELLPAPKTEARANPASKPVAAPIGLDMSTTRCVKRPLASGKPGETVTVCE